VAGKDVIGDIHGCHAELMALIRELGYEWHLRYNADLSVTPRLIHPEGRSLRFLGDMMDRGPASMQVAYDVAVICSYPGSTHQARPGNHDNKFVRALKGGASVNPLASIRTAEEKIRLSRPLQKTLEEFHQLNDGDRNFILGFMQSLALYGVDSFDHHNDLVTVHGALPRELVGSPINSKIKSYCLYGEVLGKAPQGYPIRGTGWTEGWQNSGAICVYGHTVVEKPLWINDTLNIDTGCVFGGMLTAFRYPEGHFVSVKAQAQYAEHKPD
jgi:protein phosphatase